MASDPTLRRSYLKFNDEWFESKLPHSVEVFWEPANGNLGETFEFETLEETCGEPVLGIRIDPTLRFAARLWKFTLLHECCHVKLYPHFGHGKKFDREMLRLANAGAFRNLW